MKDPIVDDAIAWDLGSAGVTMQEMADALLVEHAKLKAADQAILDAQHVREVIWARERDLRVTVATRMSMEKLTKIDRPLGSIVEITARTTPEAGGSRRVISVGCLRILPPKPAPPADPLFVFRAAERAVVAPDEETPISERRRRVG